MIGKDCVGIATDTRLGQQLQTISTEAQKVFKMQDNILLGLAGLATDIQTFHRKMRYKLKLYQLREGKNMKPETFARLVGTTLYEHRMAPFYLMPVVIGLENGKPLLVNYDSIGTYSGNENFVFQGSSATNMASLCESLYKDNMNEQQLYDALASIITNGIDTDILAGWGAIVYIMSSKGIEAKYLKTKMI